MKKNIYLYPITEASFAPGGNDYIIKLIQSLKKNFNVINSRTKLGIIDMFIGIWRSDYLYLNWPEDMPDKRFGSIQSLIFIFVILPITIITRTKIVWFIHNNLSHTNKNFILKRILTRIIVSFSSIILSHSKEVNIPLNNKKVYSFDHPVEKIDLSEKSKSFNYDILIWGKISPYKGVYEFAKACRELNYFSEYKIVIAGKFISDSYYDKTKAIATDNITIINKIITDDELRGLFMDSKYILFTYNSASILSSAALCKAIAFKKIILGPCIGAFKELGQKKIIYTYNDYHDLKKILETLKTESIENKELDIGSYIENNSWENFSIFLNQALNKK